MECDHLGLTDLDRKLISAAVANSARVFLAPMDKGLSGSSVWQARWKMKEGPLSKLHVFKIGPIRKLSAEDRAIAEIASVIDRSFPLARLYHIDGEEQALLRQEFAGDADGSTISLRNYIRLPKHEATVSSVKDIIDRLYSKRMHAWHYGWNSDDTEFSTIAEAVPWWPSKIDLPRVAREIGFQSLQNELELRHGLSIEDLSRLVHETLHARRPMAIGPVHGDLHATNVNLDQELGVHLIDFGNTTYTWRAIDFIILEAAIKFAAAPVHAPLSRLLNCEELIDQSASPDDMRGESFYGAELRKILVAAVAIREHCARSRAEINIDNYRAGLICVCAAFTSIEWMVNRRFLFHSIAYHLKRMGGHAE